MSNPFVLAREVTGEPFVAKIGDEEFTFTNINHVNQLDLADLMGRGEQMTNVEFMAAVLNLAAEGDTFDRLRGLNLGSKELSALYAAYNTHNGVAEGESAPSSS